MSPDPGPHVRVARGLQRGETAALKRGIQEAKSRMEPFDALTVAMTRKPTILEVFSGHSEITIQARACGWQALQPFELAYGEDAMDPEDKRKLLELVKKEKPDLVVITPPCGPWSPLQNLTADRELLAVKRKMHRPL